jgi:hypothetical protein
MLLSVSLQQIINQARLQVIHHPQHALMPVYRQQIYHALNTEDETVDGRTYKHLAISTARFVVPFWQQVWPLDEMPNGLLYTAECFLAGKIDVTRATANAENAWQNLEALGSAPNNFTARCAFHAGHATLEALFAALDRPPFNNTEIDEHTTDADLDPWTSDTALWASTAYAGGVWDAESDLKKRLGFWRWWLDEAIPDACLAAHQSFS